MPPPAERMPFAMRLRLWRINATDVNDLFVPVGKREVRFNWRHPLAIPVVLAVIVLSPLLLLWAGYIWVLRRTSTFRQPHTPPGS